jgi:hypothetical protein
MRYAGYSMSASDNTKHSIFTGCIFICVIIAGPLAGVLLSGEPLSPYLEFPPQTIRTYHPPFSWTVFLLMLLFIIITTWSFWRRLASGSWIPERKSLTPGFPWWGWLGMAGLVGFWILAWTRFPWFELFQRHTFFPLWFSFILVLNALALRLNGKSLLTHRPVYFALLFPASAVFWWVFEYLNRFVNNWYYIGVTEISGWQYFGEATLAFSTVLPAVMSMRFILLQIPVFSRKYRNFPSIPWLRSKRLWGMLGLVSIVGLVGTGWEPQFTYPLIWIIPGLLWITFRKWKEITILLLEDAARGDLTLLWASAISALLCGFFWEMWNFHSEARWVYSIPGAERFYLFEMPVLGYAGYLPFGVICALVSNSLLSTLTNQSRIVEEEV